jgi:hypothetical protein
MDVGKIAASSAGNLNFSPVPIIVFQDQHPFAAIGSGKGTEHPGTAAPDHDDIKMILS